MTFFRALLALGIGWAINRGLEDPGLAFMVYLLAAWLLVYLPGRKRSQKAEYVADAAGNATGQLFVPSQHPGYKQVFSDSNGRSFVNGAGSILCTRYVTESGNTGSRIIWMFVVAVIGVLLETGALA